MYNDWSEPFEGDTKSFINFPDEILLQILSCIDPDRDNRILGHVPDGLPLGPDDSNLSEDFLDKSRTYCNLSLTCKRLRPLAQEQLLYSPVIECSTLKSRSCVQISSLVRTLAARNELGRHVKRLHISFPSFEIGGDLLDGSEEPSAEPEKEEKSVAIKTRCDLIDSLNLPNDLRNIWCSQTKTRPFHTFIGVLLTLLPQLERLYISERRSGIALRQCVYDMFGIYSTQYSAVHLERLQRFPIVQSLTHLSVSSLLPIVLEGLAVFPNLHTLDLTTRFSMGPQRRSISASELYLSVEVRERFRNIHYLRIDFRVRSVGIWSVAARVCLTNILQGFRNLKGLSFYAESSQNRNPYRSVRAFPHYQTNIQNYPDIITSAEPDNDNQYWDQIIYNARTEATDYQHLVDHLVHLKPQLETLRLPGGFWTLPGAMRKPLPRIDRFERLNKLAVPQAAIISIKLDNMRFPEVSGDFELSPAAVLPRSLRHLEIFDADITILRSAWIRDLFSEQDHDDCWPNLERLAILFGATCRNVEVAKLQTREHGQEFWQLADKAPFEVILGRDDEEPLLRGEHDI